LERHRFLLEPCLHRDESRTPLARRATANSLWVGTVNSSRRQSRRGIPEPRFRGFWRHRFLLRPCSNRDESRPCTLSHGKFVVGGNLLVDSAQSSPGQALHSGRDSEILERHRFLLEPCLHRDESTHGRAHAETTTTNLLVVDFFYRAVCKRGRGIPYRQDSGILERHEDPVEPTDDHTASAHAEPPSKFAVGGFNWAVREQSGREALLQFRFGETQVLIGPCTHCDPHALAHAEPQQIRCGWNFLVGSAQTVGMALRP
jgi:hypothetical protein